MQFIKRSSFPSETVKHALDILRSNKNYLSYNSKQSNSMIYYINTLNNLYDDSNNSQELNCITNTRATRFGCNIIVLIL
jgi:hypothetical protein